MVDLSGLVREVTEELSDRIEAKNINLQLRLPASIQIPDSNYDLLFQLVYNIVNNAIRYNREGGDIRISGAKRDGGFALHIADTGQGIPSAAIPTLFHRFKRSGQSMEDGYGLGLAIVKAIADYHGIGLEVRSEEGNGAEFIVMFTTMNRL